jgi:AraC family transcriptional regulator
MALASVFPSAGLPLPADRFNREQPPAHVAPPRPGLLKWRLKRVLHYIEANLSEPISLPKLAAAAGLSRMHFAAQFRAATGLRPHDFVVRRRIERAQELLRDPALPLVEVALSVGFQTQAHFTTVFRTLVMETPGRWRKLELN